MLLENDVNHDTKIFLSCQNYRSGCWSFVKRATSTSLPQAVASTLLLQAATSTSLSSAATFALLR